MMETNDANIIATVDARWLFTRNLLLQINKRNESIVFIFASHFFSFR